MAGTCLSSRTRSGAPNSFNYIEITEGHHDSAENQQDAIDLKITRYDLDLQGVFKPLSYVKFRRELNQPWRPH